MIMFYYSAPFFVQSVNIGVLLPLRSKIFLFYIFGVVLVSEFLAFPSPAHTPPPFFQDMLFQSLKHLSHFSQLFFIFFKSCFVASYLLQLYIFLGHSFFNNILSGDYWQLFLQPSDSSVFVIVFAIGLSHLPIKYSNQTQYQINSLMSM